MTLSVVGLGCGSRSLLTPQAYDALAESDVVFTTAAYRGIVDFHPNVVIMENLSAALDNIGAALPGCRVAVGVSGDPGIYSYTKMLKRHFGEALGDDFKVVPGISSLQYFCSTLGESWNDAAILSAHGRDVSGAVIRHRALANAKTIVFCDREHNPRWVCETLAALPDELPCKGALRVAIGENLSQSDERVTCGSLPELLASNVDFGAHALVAIFNDAPMPPVRRRPRDDDFIKSKVPMTRQEVRSVILDELQLNPDSIVWDIGAGSGSVAVACALSCVEGEVHAVERYAEAVDLIKQNRDKFAACNLRVYHGRAPDILNELPVPTHVFIGGSDGSLGEILRRIAGLGAGIRVCVSSVTLETSRDLSLTLMDESLFGGLEVVSISVARSRALGKSLLMSGQNPVAVWSAVTK